MIGRRGAEIAIAHTFVKPPYGGSNQFLLALWKELESRGLDVGTRIGRGTRVCLLHAAAFDEQRVRRRLSPGCRVVHRVDGPIARYRGFDDGSDARVATINADLADATILQSRYSLEAHRELGIELRDPRVVVNAVDPEIFSPPEEPQAPASRFRVVASSWSDNRNKGAESLEWLDANLDFDRYALTFVGRTQSRFQNIETVGALPSEELADVLRAHDAYLAPSRDDPCSNALLEALACGLPAVFRDSGGHPELVGAAGVGYRAEDELPAALERVREEHAAFRARIRVPALADVADAYLDAMGLG